MTKRIKQRRRCNGVEHCLEADCAGSSFGWSQNFDRNKTSLWEANPIGVANEVEISVGVTKDQLQVHCSCYRRLPSK